jgi:integrase
VVLVLDQLGKVDHLAQLLRRLVLTDERAVPREPVDAPVVVELVGLAVHVHDLAVRPPHAHLSKVHPLHAERAFRDAVRWGRLARNPADVADPPKTAATARPTMTTWSAGEVGVFLQHVRGHRLAAAFIVLATTGMRRGECLGLRWKDLDLEASRISIVQTVIAVNHEVRIGSPKTAKGRRTVALDAGTIAALREHRQRQVAERLLIGTGFTDHGLVFCRPDGGPLHPERFSRTFGEQAAKAGLPPIRLHDLRHSWATLALSAGVHPKVVQERSAMQPSASRWTSTATSRKGCTATRRPSWPG